MRVTYIVTWEEYAEQLQDTWPRPDYFSAIVICMVALPLIGYGISLAVFGAPDETILNSMFIGGPLVLAVAAILSITSQARRAKTQAVAEKRLGFDKWSAGEQSFAFDQEKWTHETEAGKQESLWSARTVVIERESGFWLATEKTTVMVPKRMLDSSALALFRQAALPVRGDGWTFQTRCWDHQATETVLLWRKRWFALAFGNVFALVVLGWIVQTWLSESATPRMIWGWILAAIAVVLTLTAQLWYLPLQYATWPRQFRAPMTLEFSDAGVSFATAHANFFLAWKAFRKFQEIGRAFLIYTDPSHYYQLPKRDMTPDQRAALRRILQEKLKLE
jgi:hypothetical protein